MFYPQIVVSRHTQRALAERKGTGALWTCPAVLRIRARTDAAVVCALAVHEEALLGPFCERIAEAWAPEYRGRQWVMRVRDWSRRNGVFGFG